MSSCKIDHPKEDVYTKLTTQKEFLPVDLYNEIENLLVTQLTQTHLNEIFHLLKKYDLSSKEEQNDRNTRLYRLIQKETGS